MHTPLARILDHMSLRDFSVRKWVKLRLAAPAKPWPGFDTGPRDPLKEFCARLAERPAPRVLELGTLRSIAGRSTLHREWAPHAAEHLGTDIEAGADVDVVADVHALSATLGEESFDALISCSTFEHLKYPHLAAHEVMKVLKVGGLLFTQTHQSFPIHAYPFDYFRFSREALAGLFGTRMGFEVLATNYCFPASIWARETPGGHLHPAYLNTNLFGVKTAATPKAYVYELEYRPVP